MTAKRAEQGAEAPAPRKGRKEAPAPRKGRKLYSLVLVGGSLRVCVPAELRHALKWNDDDKVVIEQRGNQMVVTRARRV